MIAGAVFPSKWNIRQHIEFDNLLEYNSKTYPIVLNEFESLFKEGGEICASNEV
jgi:hypothetical protein